LFGAAALALINTDRPGAADALNDARWLTANLAAWGVPSDRPVTDEDLAAFRALRATLRATAVAVTAGTILTSDDLAALNAILAVTPVIAQVMPDGDRYVIDMTPVGAHWREIGVREIAGSFASMLRADPTRLRICAAPGCDTAFWDDTRSRTRTWCDTRTCGNRVRVQRHRDANR
jgi:predicted RNA-binding Zn ribbon-like protein